MAAWPELARQLLRPTTRRPQTWRTRGACALLFASAGIWSAVAPQANFALGERLRLAYETIFVMTVALGLLAGALHRANHDIFQDVRIVPRWQRSSSRILSMITKGANDLLPALPLLFLLLALEAISFLEFSKLILWTAAALITSTTISEFKGPILLWPIATAVLYANRRRPPFESILILLYAGHLYWKARLAWAAKTRIISANLAIESTTLLSPAQLCVGPKLHPAILSLLAIHLTLLAAASLWPLGLDEKFALALVLIVGIFSLFVDSFALHWRGMIDANPPRTLATILGIPWAVAWILAALHTGDAFTLNEAAAYFLVWSASGLTLSWFAGSAAKERILGTLREVISLKR
jgi:hypothetical protein